MSAAPEGGQINIENAGRRTFSLVSEVYYFEQLYQDGAFQKICNLIRLKYNFVRRVTNFHRELDDFSRDWRADEHDTYFLGTLAAVCVRVLHKAIRVHLSALERALAPPGIRARRPELAEEERLWAWDTRLPFLRTYHLVLAGIYEEGRLAEGINELWHANVVPSKGPRPPKDNLEDKSKTVDSTTTISPSILPRSWSYPLSSCPISPTDSDRGSENGSQGIINESESEEACFASSPRSWDSPLGCIPTRHPASRVLENYPVSSTDSDRGSENGSQGTTNESAGEEDAVASSPTPSPPPGPAQEAAPARSEKRLLVRFDENGWLDNVEEESTPSNSTTPTQTKRKPQSFGTHAPILKLFPHLAYAAPDLSATRSAFNANVKNLQIWAEALSKTPHVISKAQFDYVESFLKLLEKYVEQSYAIYMTNFDFLLGYEGTMADVPASFVTDWPSHAEGEEGTIHKVTAPIRLQPRDFGPPMRDVLPLVTADYLSRVIRWQAEGPTYQAEDVAYVLPGDDEFSRVSKLRVQFDWFKAAKTISQTADTTASDSTSPPIPGSDASNAINI